MPRTARRSAEQKGPVSASSVGAGPAREVETSVLARQAVERRWRDASEPQERHLREVRAGIAAELSQLEARQRDRADFIDAHPDVMGRVAQVGRAIEVEAERRRPAATVGPVEPPDPRRPPVRAPRTQAAMHVPAAVPEM